MSSVLGTVVGALLLVIAIIVWRYFAEKWHESAMVQKYRLTLWVRLLMLGAVILFVVWQFIPYQSVMK